MAELFLGGLVDAATHERTGDDVRLETEDLTTHGVIVGMTGSGKTGLGVVLIEEVLAAGLPALLIDPEGRPHQPLPDVPATWRRPTSARGSTRPRPRRPASPPDEFAAQQATAWRDGLAGWGYGPDADRRPARRRPTSRSTRPARSPGVPINIVGSLQAPDTDDAEVIGDEIEGYVSGLLGLVGIDADPLSSREHILLANLIQHAWSAGHRRSTCRRSSAWSSSRRSASSACSSSTSSSRRPTARRWR